MPLQNRVLPNGSIVASPARGTMMGNRGGCFHRDDRTLRPRHWASRQWICCVLEFKSRRRKVMTPGRYTELFFLDEATALAAGHRPCFECRRADAVRFQSLWTVAMGLDRLPAAPEMDAQLHAERTAGARRTRIDVNRLGDLPDGAMVLKAGEGEAAFWLKLGGSFRRWTIDGYAPSDPTATAGLDIVELLTPPTILRILGAGYAPRLHSSVSRKSPA